MRAGLPVSWYDPHLNQLENVPYIANGEAVFRHHISFDNWPPKKRTSRDPETKRRMREWEIGKG